MKKLLLLLSFVFFIIQVHSQVNYPYVIGFGGTTLKPANGFKVAFSGGSVVATPFKSAMNGYTMIGFPPNLKYFSNTFSKDLFASKGYYAGYVELKWEVAKYGDQITRFNIWRKKLGSSDDSVMVGSLTGTDREWKDEYAESGVIYKYTLHADGVTNDFNEHFLNYIEGIGFRFPSGRVSGRITYEGGTAVEGVNVYAETADKLGGKSIFLNGTDAYIGYSPNLNDPYFKFDTAFCFQGWFKPQTTGASCLFEKYSQYKIIHQPGKVTFYAGGTSVSVNFPQKADTFFNVSAMYDGDTIKLYVLYDNKTWWKSSAKIVSQPVPNDNGVFIGKDNSGDYYKGYVDELRIWYRSLTETEIIQTSGIYISGTEKNLTAYYRCDEGIGTNAYDLSRSGYEFNENHSEIIHGQWTSVIPFSSQLAYKGISDANGNYIISGIPYATNGSTYSITPVYDVHKFDPTQSLLFIGEGSDTHDGINFTDVSSFPVQGNVRYLHTAFPVDGVNIMVDGRAAVTKDGNTIQTDANGNFTVDVPIGKHYISVTMNGHGFQNNGRYPMPEPGNLQPLKEFQEPVSGLKFIDTTLIKVIGRVVGGPIQASKTLGVGKSTNNIGNATVLFSTQKQRDLTDALTDTLGEWKNAYYKGSVPAEKGKTAWRINKLTPKQISINPDTETGEFVAWLLPEKYTVTSVTAGNYIFGEEFKTVLDLTNAFNWQGESDTTVESYTISPTGEKDSVLRIDSARYQSSREFIYRELPTISVTAKDGSNVFWDKTVVAGKQTINLNDANGNPLTGFPVFTQRENYAMKIKVFEKYVNADHGNSEDIVPVTDGTVDIQNFLSLDDTKQTYEVDSQGEVNYEFTGGLPNITTDASGGYTKTMTIQANTGNNGSIKTSWPASGIFKAFLFGGMPTGNNFVTTGPNELITILRDPPGSNSYSYLEKGTTLTNSTSYAAKGSFEGSEKVTFQLGAEVKVFAGVGAGTITETDYKNDVTTGLEQEVNWSDGNSTTTTTTTTQRWQTSGDPDFVGAQGDVFIGYATNIVYGKSIFISLIPSTDCGGSCTGNEVNGYKVGKSEGLRLNPEFGTSFMFSQDHIQNYLIPNLEALRNSFLDKGTVYVSKLPASSPDYGRANNDTLNKATYIKDNKVDGDSYSVTVPATWPKDSIFVDSVYFFNQQVSMWEDALRRNESEKIKAKLKTNLSFDGGATYEYSLANDTVTSETKTTDFMISPVVATDLGFEFNKFGMHVQLEEKVGGGNETSSESSTENTVTYGYSLADQNEGDYISLDVLEPPAQTGPVFAIRGGQTECPWENAVVTQYEQPGKIISQATMQREKPYISVDNPIQSNVQEDQAANFNLLLQNASETGDGAWFSIIVDHTTNQKGAKIMIDGSPIDNERLINVPAGKTVEKVLSVSMTLPGVYDYENIGIIVRSTCDGSIADTTYVTAHFKPVCSGVKMTLPGNPWTVNTVTDSKQIIGITDYNLNHPTFEKILFQYKPVSSSEWITDNTFYVKQQDYDAAQQPKTFINNNPSIAYNWDMSSLMDRNYDIRVKTVCSDLTENDSDPFTGIKDMKPPKVFGTPQPADGILSPDDDMMVTFDEPIQAGLLTPYNFSVRAVLNGYKKDHNAYLYFDGIQSYANVLSGIPLNNKSFTIEFWAKRGTTGAQVIYSQGNDMEIGFDATDKFYAKLGGTTISTGSSYTDVTTWQHWAVTYDKDNKTANIYMNDQMLRLNMPVSGSILGEGKMLIGKSTADDRFFNGYIHEFRIWEKALPFSTVYANLYTGFNGSEVGLAGYWPMDEVEGLKAQDLARHRHAVLYNTGWRVDPSGKARDFNGSSDYVTISTGSTVVITKDMDYTLEFWFKAPKQRNTVLFSSGKADGANNNTDEVLVGVNANGEIYALNNNLPLVATGQDYLDNAWHHFALVMNRIGNLTLFIDGVQQATARGVDFGGFTGASMCVGARMYLDQGIQHDEYFSGKIDELRIWKLARELKQITMDKNAHLTGKELGLCAYYPFEYYFFNMGVPEIRETLDDQYIPQYTGYPTGGTATAAGGTFTDDVPNIKDARPVQDIGFDWTVNSDKINITTKEPNELIEKTTVEITVQNVEDLNENRLVSPVTWTAYINKNQVVWDATELTLSKKIYDTLTFKVDIMNLGGKQENFSLLNLPSWLHASVTTGTLAPDSKLTITFSVDESLNIGKYQESVFLHSDFGFDEKLLIDLNVFKPAPDWKVDKNKYQYSMNVIAQLKVDGEISTDPDDMVGAFVNGECRGVAHLSYFDVYDKYISFIDIYSNNATGDTVKFMIWDASEGIIRNRVTPSYPFITNDVKGTVLSPEILSTLDIYYSPIAMVPGWNWVSFNLNSAALSDVSTTLSKLNRTAGDQIKGPVDSTGMIVFDNYASGSWSRNSANKGGLRPGYMYMVKTSETDTIEFEGSKIKTDSPILLNIGWNWLGYPRLTAMTVNDAFAFYGPAEGDLIKSKYAFSMYNAATGWIGSLDYLKPGEGYMFRTSKTDHLTYPESGYEKSLSVENSKAGVPALNSWNVNEAQYPVNMSIVAKVVLPDNTVANDEWRLGVFAGDACRGTAIPRLTPSGDYTCFLTVSGNSLPESIKCRIINISTGKTMAIRQALTYNPDQVSGTIKEPVILNAVEGDLTSARLVDPNLDGKVSPNPFSDYLKMTIYSPADGNLVVQVCNSLGLVLDKQQVTVTQGSNVIEWGNSYWSKYAAGIYYLKFQINGQSKVLMVVKE